MVAAHRTVQTLQVAVDDKDQIVQPLARGKVNRTPALRFVHLAIAEKTPDLAVAHIDMAPVVHVFHEPRLIDRHQRPQPHRNRRELPVIRHQPGVRIARQTLAVDFAAEIFQLGLADASFHKAARIDAGNHMSLKKHQVAAVDSGFGAPEMVQPNIVHHRRTGKGRDMPAIFAGHFITAHNRRHRVPAVDGADAPFHFDIAGKRLLIIRRYGVLIRRRRRKRQVRPGRTRLLNRLVQQKMCAIGSIALNHILNRFLPLLGFNRINVLDLVFHRFLFPFNHDGRRVGLKLNYKTQHR